MIDKDLLFKDFFARLPYKVKVQYKNSICFIDTYTEHNKFLLVDKNGNEFPSVYSNKLFVGIEEFKPYLFPLSSMTEEQLYEFSQILGKDCDISGGFIEIIDSCRKTFSYQEIDALFQLMNKHHIDYRGLIEKGLAIDCTNLNIY